MHTQRRRLRNLGGDFTRMSSSAKPGIYPDTANHTILIEQEQPGLVCTITESKSAESEQRLVKALKWLLDSSNENQGS